MNVKKNLLIGLLIFSLLLSIFIAGCTESSSKTDDVLRSNNGPQDTIYVIFNISDNYATLDVYTLEKTGCLSNGTLTEDNHRLLRSIVELQNLGKYYYKVGEITNGSVIINGKEIPRC